MSTFLGNNSGHNGDGVLKTPWWLVVVRMYIAGAHTGVHLMNPNARMLFSMSFLTEFSRPPSPHLKSKNHSKCVLKAFVAFKTSVCPTKPCVSDSN